MALTNSEIKEIERLIRKEIRDFMETSTIKQYEDKILDKVQKEIKRGKLEGEIKEALSMRSDLIPQIEKSFIELYEKVRNSGVIGAVRLKNGQCGGCNLTINSGDLSKLLALPEEEVARCEECRCILVRQ